MSNVYISPVGAGDKSGSSWTNAAPITRLDVMIKKAGPDGKVLLAADKGAYKLLEPLNITGSGATITGMNTDGSAGDARFEGTRAPDWKAGAANGNELFRILKGADDLKFENMFMVNIGTVFRVGGDVSDLTIQHIQADNVRRFFENYVSGSNKTATISGLTIRDVEVEGFSKGVIRLQYDTHDVLIEDVRGDSERQVGDDFAMGVHLGGTVHDVVMRRVVMENATQEAGPGKYWNGDGFATERKTFNIMFEDTAARGSTDGGYDIKSSHVTMVRALAEDNAKNFRFWGTDVVLIDPVGLNPHARGGTNNQEQLWLSGGASVKVIGGTFSDSGSKTRVIENDGRLELVDTSFIHAIGGKAYSGNKPVGFGEAAIKTVAATGTASSGGHDDGPVTVPAPPKGGPTPPIVIPNGDKPADAAAGGWNKIRGTAANETLLATRGADMFVFDQGAKSGADTIRGFAANDVVVFRAKLNDGNGDGVVAPGKDGKLSLGNGSTLKVEGLEKGLRLLGEVAEGFAYGDAAAWKAGATLPNAVKQAAATEAKFVAKAGDETFVATGVRDTFRFDVGKGGTGTDKIQNFGADDALVTARALADGNRDGLITPGKNGFDLGDRKSVVSLSGLGKDGLRALGATEEGFVYADAAVRPKGAKEGKLTVADTLSGDKRDAASDRFFFDTALHRDLGDDKIVGFGARDVVITTSRLGEGNVVRAEKGAFRLADEGVDLGGLRVADLSGRAVDALEFDGARTVNGVEYFVYSAVGSAVGLDALIG